MLIAIKKMSPDGKIPRGLLMHGKPAINDALREFELSEMMDKNNAKFPRPGMPKPTIGGVKPRFV